MNHLLINLINKKFSMNHQLSLASIALFICIPLALFTLLACENVTIVSNIPSNSVPAAPELPQLTADSTQVSLVWESPTFRGYTGGDGTMGTINKYTVYWQEMSPSLATNAKLSTITAFNIDVARASNRYKEFPMDAGASLHAYIGISDGLETDKDYDFVITATNEEGESSISEIFSGTLSTEYERNDPPGVVTNLMASGTNSQIILTWNSPSYKGKIYGKDGTAGVEGVITRYSVYYSKKKISNLYDRVNVMALDVEPTNEGEEPPRTLALTNLLFDGTVYYFAVTAWNSFAEGRALPEGDTAGGTIGTPLAQDRVPGIPESLLASPGDALVKVSWIPPLDTGIINNDGTTGLITNYTVYFSEKDNFTDLSVFEVNNGKINAGTSLSIEISENIYNNTTYYFVVSATNSTGEGMVAASVSATPEANFIPNSVPGPPTIVNVTAGKRSAIITWDPPTDTGTINNNGDWGKITNYKIYYSTQSTFRAVGTEGSDNVLGTETSAEITDINSDITYFFILTAINEIGEGAPSDVSYTIPLKSDAEVVAADKELLQIVFAAGDSANAVSNTIVLPDSGINGSDITWESDKEVVNATEGTIVKPDIDTKVLLIATITYGEVSDTKNFTITVVSGLSDSDSVIADKEILQIRYTEDDTQNNVTKNLILPVSGSYGTVITWKSSHTSIIDSAGKVTRPDVNGSDTPVTLTATISKGDETITKEFTVTVIKMSGLNNNQAVEIDKAALAISYAENDDKDNVTQDITLPISGANETEIKWSSSHIGILSNSGKVNRPEITGQDTQITLIATITKGEATDTKEFLLIVKKKNYNDAQSVGVDRAALTIGYSGSEDRYSVTQNLILADSGTNGTTITWVSNNTAYIADDGTVTQPEYDDGHAQVTLTATITKNQASAKREFIVLVLKKDANVPGIPEGLTATTVGNKSVTLTWDFLSDNGGTVITQYTVYWSETQGGAASSSSKKSAGTSTTVDISNLKNDTTYYFVIKAKNAIGEGEASTEISATPIADNILPGIPLAPRIIGWVDDPSNSGKQSVELEWDAVDPGRKDGNIATVVYTVYAHTSNDFSDLDIVTANGPKTDTTTQVNNLEPGTLYYFKIMADNGFGGGLLSEDTSQTHTNSKPGTPTFKDRKIGDKEIELEWDSPDAGYLNGVQAKVTQFKIYQDSSVISVVSGLTPILITTDATTLMHTVTGLENATQYFFAIVAVIDLYGETAAGGGDVSVAPVDSRIDINTTNFSITIPNPIVYSNTTNQTIQVNLNEDGLVYNTDYTISILNQDGSSQDILSYDMTNKNISVKDNLTISSTTTPYTIKVISQGNSYKGELITTFNLTVTMSDQAAVDADHASLELGYQGSDTSASVTQNILITKQGANGTTITWGTPSRTYIAALFYEEGYIRILGYPGQDISVSITATITKGNRSKTKTFTFTVKGT